MEYYLFCNSSVVYVIDGGAWYGMSKGHMSYFPSAIYKWYDIPVVKIVNIKIK